MMWLKHKSTHPHPCTTLQEGATAALYTSMTEQRRETMLSLHLEPTVQPHTLRTVIGWGPQDHSPKGWCPETSPKNSFKKIQTHVGSLQIAPHTSSGPQVMIES